jgi:Fe-S cluster assembly protein SufD
MSSGTAWDQSLRQEARSRFDRLGLPSRKNEAWHYTDLSQLDLAAYGLAEPMPAVIADPVALHLRNGFLCGVPPLPDGVTLERLEASAAGQALVGRLLPVDDRPVIALNAGLFTDAMVLRVAAGARVRAPVNILWESLADEGAVQFHQRLLVLLEQDAHLTLVETQRGQGPSFSTRVAEFQLAPAAVLQHVLVQDDSLDAVHLGSSAVVLAENSAYHGTLLQLGGRLARHELHALLDGSGALLSQRGATVALGRQHLDNTTRLVHRAPSCQSRQLFKTVLGDHGHGVFQGSVLVERSAQKTNAHQLSRALMLSDRAAMDNKPELEIYADDVKCGHGATIGDIDRQQLFYLQARGIDAPRARQLLIEAFLAEVLDPVTDPSLRRHLTALISARVSGLGAEAAA